MRFRTLALTATLLLLVTACGGDDDGSATTEDGGAGSSAPPTTTSSDGTTTSAEMADAVHAADTDLGSILVDPEGFTLYVFTADSPGQSTCNDGCAELWPPVPGNVAMSPDLDASAFGVTTRDDGSEQLTVNEMPLYRYTPDQAPGDTSGQGANDVWFVVDSQGEMITAAAGGVALVDYGY